MQPPPRSGPPGASSGPPSGGPNMFRRTRPHKHTSTVPSTAQPMTDPFSFVRAPTPLAGGGFPAVPNSNPPTMPIPPSTFFSQTGSGQPPQSLQDAPSTSTGSTTPSLPGVTMFNPSNTSSGVFPAQAAPIPTASYSEQSYFNSREQTPSMANESAHEASAPAPNQTATNQEYYGPPPLFSLSHQPVPTVSASSQWAPDHGSRPPSVQNYFQPTSDPPTQPMNMQPYSQMFLPLAQSPHHNAHTPPTQPGQPSVQTPLQHPGRSQYIESNTTQHPNTYPPIQNYFSQSTNLSPLDSGYHQMGSVIGDAQPTSDSAPLSASSTSPRSVSAPAPHVLSQESGTLSMFFKDDVENEETITSDANKAANGIADSFPHLNNHPVNSQLHSSHAGVVFDFHGTPFQPSPQMPYVNDRPAAHGNNQKPTDSLYDHVENFECVPNQEVLPTERQTSPVSTATHVVDQFETGPNLETPDSAPRPMRSASVSSNYSNLSHGSGTGTRRHQGVVGTFIQQESPRLTEDFNQSATGGYFEQIDSSSAGDMTAHNAAEKNWPPTPSPPKPVGTFQASANSSFEPVRSHSVGVRPVEVDRANMVVEGGADSTPGNLEQPPDNMENIYCLGPPLVAESSGSVPLTTVPVVHSHSRPSSRAYGASRPCESPATTLWAQNDPSSLGTNIVLAPAAPTVLAPLREPSSDVIQPPEDGPLDLHPPQRAQSDSNHHSENLENPPRVSEAEPPDPQGSLGYASLLVSESLHQPILIAPPVSNYNVIPASTPTQAGSPTGPKESVQLSRTVSQSQPLPHSSLQNPLFASSSNQSPLNLTREKSESATLEMTAQPQLCPPVSRSQSVVGESQPSVVVNSQASLVTPVSNHNAPTNYELLDFSMHHSQTQNQASGHSSSLQDSQQFSNGFYLQVTKDAQQGVKAEGEASVQRSILSSSGQVAHSNPELNTQQLNHEPVKSIVPLAPQHRQTNAPPVSETDASSSLGQYSSPTQGTAADAGPSAAYPQGPQGSVPPSPVPAGGSQLPPEPPRPPSTAGSQQGYGPPAAVPPGGAPGYRGYYAGNYGEYPDSRSYLPGQYPPPPGDSRSQYYPEDPYRNRADPWYGRYDGATQAYRDPNYQYREPPPERPSSRTSQYSDRPSSRQGYPDEYRANRGAYTDYYADYPNHYNYAGYNYGAFDPRYRGYYDQSYWSAEGYRGREAYYNQQMYPSRKNGYDDQWRYYPGYDPSFDDDYRWRGETYNDDFDRRSVHSEQSAHSVHSTHSNHSRRSSFSSRSQQSQVYRSQPDLVSAVYDNTSSTLAVDYSYGQYPNQTDASQNYSQYPYPSEYTTDTTWIAPEQPPPRPATPEKFTIPHRCARFGPGGHMVQVLPNLPSAGQPALVDIHNLETMLQDTSAQVELRAFPGPLIKEDTHKVDVIKFSQNKALECSRDSNLLDRDSARLLWDFIVLLCRQNGTVVGTDIADLLLKEHRSVWLPGKSPNEANLIDFNNEPLSRAEEEPGAGPLSLLSDTFMTVPENIGKETERFRELLLFGRKKDALEAAMKSGLWGHALLLASKMDSRTHARVMTRFANSLPINDPLQTVYQLMSGRMPASATCCGEEKWGDWRPHLAMILSNLTHTLDLDTRTIATMGDTLASKGLIDAAHFCYLMAQVGLGVYTKKSTKMVLIGSNHSFSFYQFASNEAIQRTEAYEYAQSLGSHSCSLPNFQVYKLIYACRLAEAGLSAQAFHYCEVISKTVLMQPSYYSPIFINQLIQMSEKLRFFDPQLKEKPEQELFREPEWLIHLRQLDGQMKTGVITYNADRSTPAQYDCSSPSSDLDEPSPPEPYSMPRELDGNTPDNPLMSTLLPGPSAQGVQLMPPAPTSILQDNMVQPQLLPPSEVPQFYPVPPAGPQGQMPFPGYPQQDPGYAPPPFQPQPEQVDMYPGPIQPPGGPPQVSQVPHHLSPQMAPPSVLMPPSPAHVPPAEQLQAPPDVHTGQPISTSPPRSSLTPQMDFYDQMANMGPGRRSRTTSQSSMHMVSGRRSRTTSESSTHSGGRERSNSAIKQASPPPPPIPEQPRKEEKKAKRDSPRKTGGRGWLDWLYRKGKNEAHLPDDKNKSIVWDEKKQRWVDLNEPEEETKPPPPPPSGFPSMPSMPGPAASLSPPTGGPSVNMFSRKAGTKSRYVDVLNPSRTANKSGGLAPAPADIFAPLAPMTMPTNLFVPSSAPDDQQPLEGSEGGAQEQSSPNTSSIPQMFNPTLVPPAPEMPSVPDGSTSGEGHPPPGAMPTGGVPFYNPAQFAQPSAPSGGGLRSGRLGGQRQYPVMK